VNKIRKQKFPLFSTDITNYFFEKSVSEKIASISRCKLHRKGIWAACKASKKLKASAGNNKQTISCSP
jgi:hypothetical protein